MSILKILAGQPDGRASLDDVKTGPAIGLAGEDLEYRHLKAHARTRTLLLKYRTKVASASGVSSAIFLKGGRITSHGTNRAFGMMAGDFSVPDQE